MLYKTTRKYFSVLIISIMSVVSINNQAMATTYTINDNEGPLSVATGDIVTVTGTGSLYSTDLDSGVDGGASNNVTVTVQNGGTVTAEGEALGGGFAGKGFYLGDNGYKIKSKWL